MRHKRYIVPLILRAVLCLLLMTVAIPWNAQAQFGHTEILTLIGGDGDDENLWTSTGILLADSARQMLYCLVFTLESDLPVTADAYQRAPENKTGSSVYFVIYNLDCSDILYATYLAGSKSDGPGSITWDESGEHLILTGRTNSPDFPITVNALQKQLNGSSDFWFARFNVETFEFMYVTFLGGAGYENSGSAYVTVDGIVLITGFTTSHDLPRDPATFSRVPDVNGDATVFVLRNDTLLHALCFGGRSDEDVSRVIETEDSFVFVGSTWSSDFPVTANAFQPNFGGVKDLFVLRTDKNFRAIEYCSYLGGISNEVLLSARHINEKIHIVGYSHGGSNRFPLTHPVIGHDWFHAKNVSSGLYAIFDPETDTMPLATLITELGHESIGDVMEIGDDRVLLLLSTNSDTLLGMVKERQGEWDAEMLLLLEFDTREMVPGRVQHVWDNNRTMSGWGFTKAGNDVYFGATTEQQHDVSPTGYRTRYRYGHEGIITRLQLNLTSAATPPPVSSREATLRSFPNPSHAATTVLLHAVPGHYRLRLYGSDGRLIRSRDFDHAVAGTGSVEIDLSKLAPGHYHLTASRMDGVPVAWTTVIAL